MKLLIGNRNYSTWSLRPWLVLRHFEIPFEDEVLQLSGPRWRELIAERSPTGKVPVLVDGDLIIPETIAIIEYLADRFPELPIWPRDFRDRALARAAAAEMHGGFSALRNHAPMNLRASHPGKVDVDAVRGDLLRIERLWGDHLSRSGGPYLFGEFTAADAMFAPLATRLRTYALPVSDQAAAYVEAIYALPAFQDWLSQALREPWIVDDDEIDVIQGRVAPGTLA
ncbi:MAG: glutathione S-transferase family protein [Devosia sp.]|jgi:glutathione S-transferase|uniref:glutathione S-transferase family protein n=1 Tax=unclassified Devosia TaxID=196773 RepID=UPI0019F4BD45|nr:MULTISPECIES: glutathione S-transferase family protein [unclassified Devosia]MBF0678583.1 glutathione S-transferase family protein [Devosia sp.]WEJ31847.1 glutathione S-transferase family protein [Devosia sp. SD17-2]